MITRETEGSKTVYRLENEGLEIEISVDKGGSSESDFVHLTSDSLDFSDVLGETGSRHQNLEDLGERLGLKFGDGCVLVALFQHDFSVKMDGSTLSTTDKWDEIALYPLEDYPDQEEDQD
ncbi:MAG: hypothetical protein ABEJ99_01140 [Candidatus Nanohaloarchaea archaeon]